MVFGEAGGGPGPEDIGPEAVQVQGSKERGQENEVQKQESKKQELDSPEISKLKGIIISVALNLRQADRSGRDVSVDKYIAGLADRFLDATLSGRTRVLYSGNGKINGQEAFGEAEKKIFFTNTAWTDTDGTDVSDSLTLKLKILVQM